MSSSMTPLEEGLSLTGEHPESDVSRPQLFLPLKELNAKLAALQLLVHDYSIETMPQWVSFTATTLCNLRCPHCQTHGTEEVRRIHNRKSWSGETLRRVAKESLPTAYEFCLTLNGEPLCTPQLSDRLDELARYGAKLHLTTNGTLLSEEVLVKLLPLVARIGISIDGARAQTCEAIRLGVKFEKLLTNIRLVTKTCELLTGTISPDISLDFTVMGSNIREMPEMVRLAHALRVPAVHFYPLLVFYPHLRGDDMKLHKPLYNSHYYRTQEEAKRLGVGINMPAPFPGVDANANVRLQRTDMIVEQLPEDCHETSPSPGSFLDQRAIEAKAAEIAARVEQQVSSASAVAGNSPSEELRLQMQQSFRALLQSYEPDLERLAGRGDEKIGYCDNLFRRLFINIEGGVTPCCVPTRPELGNINRNTVREIWNGHLYNDFRRRFFSPDLPDCCKECGNVVQVPKQVFLNQISPELGDI